MKKKILWAALAIGLAIPAVGWASAGATHASGCPLCSHCPLSR